MDFEDQLGSAMRASVATAQPPVHDLVAGGLARGRAARRRRRLGILAAGAAAVLLVAGVGVAASYDGSSRTTSTAAAGSCRSVVQTGVLPTWARDGFSDPRPKVPHVMGANGRIVAILFGGRLFAPPSDQVNNKILWVAPSVPADVTPLRIDAVRAGTTRHVHREVSGGPGPSTVDLPSAGCWRVGLRWGPAPDQRDTIDLVYARP